MLIHNDEQANADWTKNQRDFQNSQWEKLF